MLSSLMTRLFLSSADSERHLQQRQLNVEVSGSLLVTGAVGDLLSAVVQSSSIERRDGV